MSARSNEFERRVLPETRVEIADRRIRGTAIVFNSLSVDLGGFREIIKPEAVDRTLREGLDVRALVDHDSAKVLGRTKSGTLTLRKTARGLVIENDPPNTTYAKDLMESIERGDVSGMSFGFRVLTDEWRMEDGEAIRDVYDMTISEVSVVTFPAYAATDVAMRSFREFQKSHGMDRMEYLQKWHKTRLAR